jgi:3-phosphoshikimate 1-carboxyvinyltransferase
MSVRGEVRVPGDKSISHRSLIFASLASGLSRIGGILQSADVQSTAGVLRSLGVSVPDLTSHFMVPGRGLRGLTEPEAALDCGNSGTTTRLMSGVVAAYPFASTFEGDRSLSRRPMKRVAEPLTAMGARFEFTSGDGLPMTIHGGELRGISWNTRSASAQTKSAILLAGLVAGVEVKVTESTRSRDHTERMLMSLGAALDVGDASVVLHPLDEIAPLDLNVPGDPSSAAFMIALGVLGEDGEVVLPYICVNPTRIGFIQKLVACGAAIEFVDEASAAGDSVATIIARPSSISHITVTAEEVPAMIDEIPLLACVAAAGGVTLEVSGASELRVKESDRISLVVENLRAIGVECDESDDGFSVRGRRARLSGLVRTDGDHRIAMAFGILGAFAGNQIEVDDPACVRVSYPSFWDDLRSLRK